MITKEMRVSKLLEEYPASLDVLLRISPHFQKLNTPLLRRFVAPRASIEDAARVAGVELGALLTELNAACGLQCAPDLTVVNNTTFGVVPKPDALLHVLPDHVIDPDVRDDIAKQSDPFKKIMAAVKSLRPEDVLHLINVFEPVPLYGVLERRGLSHWSECINDVWHIYFYNETEGASIPSISSVESIPSIAQPATDQILEIDVAGLEPPEPMIKILASLPLIDDGRTMIVRHHREPLMLYDKLAERGYSWETTKISETEFRIAIRRKENA